MNFHLKVWTFNVLGQSPLFKYESDKEFYIMFNTKTFP